MANIKVTGLKEFQKSLNDLSKSVKDLSKEKTAPMEDILTNSFMSKNTPYADFNEFIKASGFQVKSQKDFDSIDEKELNSFVAANTKFSSFQEMINSAGQKYFKKRLEKAGLK